MEDVKKKDLNKAFRDENCNVSGPQNNSRRPSISIVGVFKGEEREGKTEKIFKEILSENFSNLMETINLYIEEAPQILKHRKFEETQH